jgi:hypothetical protein
VTTFGGDLAGNLDLKRTVGLQHLIPPCEGYYVLPLKIQGSQPKDTKSNIPSHLFQTPHLFHRPAEAQLTEVRNFWPHKRQAKDYTYVSEIADFSDWNCNDDFFTYMRERFVLDEVENYSKRSMHFDMNELVRLAASFVGTRACVNVEKCADCMYNKAFVLTMDDG